jgi:hypothetical protein
MSSQQPFEFNMAPLMKMYADSIEAWKKNYESVASNAKLGQSPFQAAPSGFARDSALGAWQKSGEEFFKKFSDQQVEIYRFFASRWEHYLKLPAQLAQCKTPAEAAQVQAAFMSQFASDFMHETQKLAQPVAELMSKWSAMQPR